MNSLNFQPCHDIKLPTINCIVHVYNYSYSYTIVAFVLFFRSIKHEQQRTPWRVSGWNNYEMVYHCDIYLVVTITDGGVGKYTRKRARPRPITYINKLMSRTFTAT